MLLLLLVVFLPMSDYSALTAVAVFLGIPSNWMQALSLGFWVRALQRVQVRRTMLIGAMVASLVAAAYALVLHNKPQRLTRLLSCMELFVPILNRVPFMGSKIGGALSSAVKRGQDRAERALEDRSATTPLAFAAINLHHRIHQILYEGYAQRQPVTPKTHPFEQHANKFETIFCFAEYFAWREQVRRQMHRNGTREYVDKLRAVDQAFSCKWSMRQQADELDLELEESRRRRFAMAVLGEDGFGAKGSTMQLQLLYGMMEHDPSLMHSELCLSSGRSKPRKSGPAALDRWHKYAAGAATQKRTPLHVLCDGFTYSCEHAPSCGGVAGGCEECVDLPGKDDSLMAATLIALGVDYEQKDGNGRTVHDLVELHGHRATQMMLEHAHKLLVSDLADQQFDWSSNNSETGD